MEYYYIYQNSELAHVRVDVAKVDSWILHVGLRVTFVRRVRGKTCKIKDSEAKVSTWIKSIGENVYEKSTMEPGTYSMEKELRVLFDGDYYGDITTLADNYRLIDNMQ